MRPRLLSAYSPGAVLIAHNDQSSNDLNGGWIACKQEGYQVSPHVEGGHNDTTELATLSECMLSHYR